MHIVAPDEARQRVAGPWFFSTALAYGGRWGEVTASDDAAAVAIWLPPAETTVSMLRMLRVGMGGLPFKAGMNGSVRFMKAMSTTETFHKQVEGPHWYLMAIGTKPERQGAGLGTEYLQSGIAKADAAGLACYLETGTESNVAYYSKRGFKVIGEAPLYGFTLYGMVRPPA